MSSNMITSRIWRPLCSFPCEITKLCVCENVCHWHISSNSACTLGRGWWASHLLMSHHIAGTSQSCGEHWEESLVYIAGMEPENARRGGRQPMEMSNTETGGKIEVLILPLPNWKSHTCFSSCTEFVPVKIKHGHSHTLMNWVEVLLLILFWQQWA